MLNDGKQTKQFNGKMKHVGVRSEEYNCRGTVCGIRYGEQQHKQTPAASFSMAALEMRADRPPSYGGGGDDGIRPSLPERFASFELLTCIAFSGRVRREKSTGNKMSSMKTQKNDEKSVKREARTARA